MAKTFVAVRDVDEETFRKFRSVAVEEKMKAGDALTLAMKIWIKERDVMGEKRPEDVLNIKPVRIGNKKVNWSTEIDETLYG